MNTKSIEIHSKETKGDYAFLLEKKLKGQLLKIV